MSSSSGVHVKKARRAVLEQVLNNLLFDLESVFERLRVHDPSMKQLVNDCVCAMKDEPEIQSSISILQSVALIAEEKKFQELEEQEDYPNEEESDEQLIQGMEMYEPLETVFTYIENFQADTVKKNYHRHFAANPGKKMTVEAHTVGFPETGPDFVCREHSAKRSARMTLWRHSAAFAEIKPSSKQGPHPSSSLTVLSRVVQSADYARLHTSARPFQLFSVGLLIFGNKFCVGIFDREGITFSPVHDMWEDLDIFVRVVRRISCDLSPYELGQDPTVKILGSGDPLVQQVMKIAGSSSSTKKSGNDASFSSFPTYKVSFGRTDPRRWLTTGPPIWNPVSLIGRGTSVWRVCRVNVNGTLTLSQMYIMKSAWRSNKRNSESEIYKSIIGAHPGVATFEAGQDVCFPGQGNRVISINELRTGAFRGETKILHRVILSTIGRPLYEYPNELLLLKAIRAAIEGHRFLQNMGILHRDVSIGNVFLSDSDNPEPGAEGFIADLDFARISKVLQANTEEIPYPPRSNPAHKNIPATEPGTRKHTTFSETPALRGAMITGTIQFMACDALDAILREEPLERKVQHDLESFIWVLAYAVRRRLCQGKSSKSPETRSFNKIFGELDIVAISNARLACLPLRFYKAPPEDLFSTTMNRLFLKLSSLVQQSTLIDKPTPLTYDSVIGELEKAIVGLDG